MIVHVDAARVILAGNPNTGKTSIFNALTGSRAKVGNYAGVTVENLEAPLSLPGGGRALLVDVPGTYSLSARSEEEQIALRAIAGLPPFAPPDVCVVVVDATQLTRNLYLALQVIEIDVPVIVALTMVDRVEAGHEIDAGALARELGVPVVAVNALRRHGLDELARTVERVLADPSSARPGWRWRPDAPPLALDVEHVAARLPAQWGAQDARRRDALALWALLSVDEDDELAGVPLDLRAAVVERRSAALGNAREIEREVIEGRYGWIDERAVHFVRERPAPRVTATDRIDRVLLHPAIGFALFLAVMAVVFQSLFTWADPAITLVEEAVGALGGVVAGALPEGLVSELLVDGVIGGVGSVLVFLPQILLLFFFVGLMEDTGYMARVAFLMDRVMRSLGLHGRAFVPMLSGYACAVPAILATRTMERRRDRLLTMMVVPLMTCSARLPVYSLLIAALYPPTDDKPFAQGLLMVAMYVFSTLVALVCAAVLGRTLLRGPNVPLILEMPPYRVPHWPSVARMMLQRSSVFVREAGTVILVCTIGMWFLLTFPRDVELGTDYDVLRAAVAAAPAEERAEQLAQIDSLESSERLRASWGGRLGRAIEPTIEPLGFDWKIGVGIVGAFAAREVFVSTMAVVYGLDEGADDTSSVLREQVREERRPDGSRVYTPLVCFSLMAFFALACQCLSTLAVVKRETRSWRWPAFLFTYMTAIAWLASFAIYQGGRLLGFE